MNFAFESAESYVIRVRCFSSKIFWLTEFDMVYCINYDLHPDYPDY